MIVYKIRHKVTGLFSKGGSNPRWSKTGKTWNRPCDLSNHFSCIEECIEHNKRWGNKDADPWPYKDAEIVISEITESSETMQIKDWRESTRENREKRRNRLRARRIAAVEQHLKEVRRKEYEKLKNEFG